MKGFGLSKGLERYTGMHKCCCVEAVSVSLISGPLARRWGVIEAAGPRLAVCGFRCK